jgi:hypothetical protein
MTDPERDPARVASWVWPALFAMAAWCVVMVLLWWFTGGFS